MTRYAMLLLMITTTGALAADHDPVLNTSDDLRAWCQSVSQASLVGRGLSPFNWTASNYDDGGALDVKGNWRVDNTKEVTVECRAQSGARASLASMTIGDPK